MCFPAGQIQLQSTESLLFVLILNRLISSSILMDIYRWWMYILFCAESAPPTPQTTDKTAAPPSWQPLANHGEAGKYCCLCGAWFNNPLMAQQHYEGKKHKRNAARTRLLEQLAGSLDANESTGQSSIAWIINVVWFITFGVWLSDSATRIHTVGNTSRDINADKWINQIKLYFLLRTIQT